MEDAQRDKSSVDGKLNGLATIRAVACECLLQDQIRNRRNGSGDHGSWGISTLDYCYLTTNEQRWTPGCGSITQTAWALLGLRDSSDLFVAEPGRLEAAATRADKYVSAYTESFLRAPQRDRSEEARNRHAATALLADLLLADLLPGRWRRSPPRFDVWEKYAGLLADLGRYLEEHGGGKRAQPSTEAALVALYPLLVRTLLRLRGSRPCSEQDAILRGLAETWQAHAVDVVACAADLLARFDPMTSPVISRPHVWAALLDGTSIVADEDDEVGSVARNLRSEVEHDAAIALANVSGSQLPTLCDGSLWEPWGTLAVLVQLGEEYAAWAGQVADGILQSLDNGRSVAAPRPILGGCTHIWSILARRAVTTKAASTQLLGTGTHLTTVRGLVRAGKFDFVFWPRDEKVRVARDSRAFEVHEAWVRGGERGTPRILRRFAELYRGDPVREVGLTRHPDSRCHSLLLAGYTTSGKSLACEFLELHTGLGRMVKRVTTASWDPGEPWEKQYYDVVSDAEFDKRKDQIFGVHQLKGARFAFVKQDFNEVPESRIRLLPIGWSENVIADVTEFCRSCGEEPLIVALRPSEQDLEQRIRKRWGGENMPQQLREAENFYERLPPGVRIIKSSGPKEEMFCEFLLLLREVLTLAEGCDVFVSYAGPLRGVAEDIRIALQVAGVRSFVAGIDTAPACDATAQKNIDRVFRLADVTVVVWSREYSMREFSSHEWITGVLEAWKRNENRVVFVTTDNTALPPEVRTAHRIEWAREGTAAVVDAVKYRMERINWFEWKYTG